MASTSREDDMHIDTDDQVCSISELGDQHTRLRNEHIPDSPHAISPNGACMPAYLQCACSILGSMGCCLPLNETDERHIENYSANSDESNVPVGSTNANDSDHSLESKHKIFLSHSGAQKDFVEQLCKDLEDRDRYPFFDKRRSSLPIGEKFPELIFDAIESCWVGVVLISEEFLVSKWPMLELNAMVKRSGSMKIIPVLYHMSVESLKDPKSLHQWVRKWKQFARDDKRINVEVWKKALRSLGCINSIVKRESDVKLREDIVMEVCMKVAMETRWDDSHVQGRVRICEIIKQKVEEEIARSKVSFIGVYGVPGIGKTTLCKVLCNALSSKFQDRVCHIEVGSERNMGLLRGASKTFRNMDSELPESMGEIEKGHALIQKKLKNGPIFLALDNLSNDHKSMEIAQSYLRASYACGSVVLVTSRSFDALKNLNLKEHNCLEMPELKDEEARALLLDCANMPIESKVDITLLNDLMKQCHLGKGDDRSKHYHPLALKVLGVQLGWNVKEWPMQLARIKSFNQLQDKDHPLFSILRNSFDTLKHEYQELFMDVCLDLPSYREELRKEYRLYWLCGVYNKSQEELQAMLKVLKMKAFLESDDITKIGVHDLWRMFAEEECRIDGSTRQRVVYVHEESTSLGIWSEYRKKVKRMCFSNWGWKGLEGLNMNAFVNVEVLRVSNHIDMGDCELDLDLSGLKHLKSLEINTPFMRIRANGLGSLSNLAIFLWITKGSAPSLEDIENLTNIQVLVLEYFNGIQVIDLTRLELLQMLVITMFPNLITIKGLSSRMANLQVVAIEECKSLQECVGVGELHALENLWFESCEELKELPFLGQLVNLRILKVSLCKSLTVVSGLHYLEALKKAAIMDCPKLSISLDFRKLSNLEEIRLDKCVKEVVGLDGVVPIRLHKATFYDVLRVEHVLSKALMLTRLIIGGWSGPIWKNISSLVMLEQLSLYRCNGEDVVPDLEGLRRLKFVWLEDCSVKDMSGMSNLIALACLLIRRSLNLEKLPEFTRLVKLKRLEIELCKNLTVCPSACNMRFLEYLSLDEYSFPMMMPKLGYLKGLEKLELTGDKCESALRMACLSRLKYLTLWRFASMKALDLGNFPYMQGLYLFDLCTLERITCSISLPALKDMVVIGCKSLVEMVDLGMFLQLESLKISDCSFLKKLNWSKPLANMKYITLDKKYPIEMPSNSMFPYLKSLRWI